MLSSTPFHGLGEDSTLHETTAFTIAKLNETSTSLQDYPVDIIIKNPLFGIGLALEKVTYLASYIDTFTVSLVTCFSVLKTWCMSVV